MRQIVHLRKDTIFSVIKKEFYMIKRDSSTIGRAIITLYV